jgi:predicted nucleic acid-binding protein
VGRLIWQRGDAFYLDSDVVIFSVERIEPYYQLLSPLWSAAAQGDVRLIGSELLLLETTIKPIREANVILLNAFRRLLTNTSLELLPITRSVLERAAQLRAASNVATPDAIHAATAVIAQCDAFLTNDKGYPRVDNLRLQLLDRILAE